MKRRFWAIAASLTVAGSGTVTTALAKGKTTTPVKEPANAEGDDTGGTDAEAAAPGGDETKPTPAAAEGKPSPNAAPVKDNPQARAAGDHLAMPPSMEGKGEKQTNENHTVISGDTLWDLSQKYLGNPWYWPKVWSYNPQIANPHWIYPGDTVKFFPGAGGDEEAPAQVQNAPEGEMEAPEEGDYGEAEDTGAAVEMHGKLGFTKTNKSSFRQDGFITDRELEESGQIYKSFSEMEMLSNYDKLYMRFKSTGDVKVGDRFFVYNTVREIKHPVTGTRFGFLTHISGTVRITEINDNQVVTGIIDNTWDEMARGYYLAPYSEKLFRAVTPKPGGAKLKGVVIEALTEVGNVGEDMVVFIDKGKRDGVEEGALYDVVRRADGIQSSMKTPGQPGYEDANLPAEVIGTLMVVDVKEDASTCLTIRSLREFVPGDTFVSTTDGAKVSER